MNRGTEERLLYANTDVEVRLGDRVRVRRWFRWREGTVCYIPRISPWHREFGEDTWAIQMDEGDMVVNVYSPGEVQPGKWLELIARGDADAVQLDEVLDPSFLDFPDED